MENAERKPREVEEPPVEVEKQQEQLRVVEALEPLEEDAAGPGHGSASSTTSKHEQLEDEMLQQQQSDTTTHAGFGAELSVVSAMTLDEAGITQFLDMGDLDDGTHFERDLQQWLALKEEEVKRMAEQLAEVEARRGQQAQEFAAEIEQLKQRHSDEIKHALAVSAGAQEELKNTEARHREELECALTEAENKHREEVEALKAQLEQGKNQENRESGEQGSLIPRLSPQLSPRGQRELRLQRERLTRQHRSELKATEQKLRSEMALESDALQSRLEEEFTAKLAEAITESALKNAAQVEQISRELRLEKQRALAQLEEEEKERLTQEVDRLSEERREAVEACKAELESARSEYQARIAAMEETLQREREERQTEPGLHKEREDWEEREEKLRAEMETKYHKQMEVVRHGCEREKEAALETLQGALEGGLQTELRRADELHKQALAEQRAQLQTDFEVKLATSHEKIQSLQAEMQRIGQQDEVRVQEAVAQISKEEAAKFEKMSETLQEVHRAELVVLETERKEERRRYQEEVEKLREELETKLNLELEQVTQSHKAEVSLLQQQYQTQLENLTLSHQQSLAQARENVEKSVKTIAEEHYHSQLEQLQNAHTAKLREVEKEGAERVVEIHQELERVKEQNSSLTIQLQTVKGALVEVKGVVEKQRGLLNEREEERERLSQQVQVATAGEKEREEHQDRQHREDSASLAILQKQLSALTNEKEALQSCLVMLQSSVSGCVQLASLVEQTLSSPPSTSFHLGNTHSALQGMGVESTSSVQQETEGEGEDNREEDTLTPPPPPTTTTPTPGHTGAPGSVARSGSVMWTKSATNLLSSCSLLKQTPSDDSGLASQQTSVANSEATLVITPMVEGSEETPASQLSASHLPHQPPNLTILPLDDTAVSLQDASQAPGLSYDQSQIGMLSVSFLDATHHSTYHHHPPPLTAEAGDLMSVSALEQSLLPINLTHLPAVQEGLSHLQDVVSALLQHYITVAAEAADYQQKLVAAFAEATEAASSQESLRQRVSELEREAKLTEEKLTDTLQQKTTAQDNLQRVVSEAEETKAETHSLRQQLSAAQETLTTTQQNQRETETQLREATEKIQAQKQTLESLETQSQLRVQMLDSQVVQLQEELQAAQRNCAGAVHEKEAMHQENKRLAGVQVTLEGQLRRLEAEAGARQRELENQLRQREDEIRELQAVRAEVSSQREVQEALASERDELRQKLGAVEHQLALSQAVSSEDQVTRIQELTDREAQLTSDLRQQMATIQALQERVQVAQESLNQTTQENLSVKMSQAQLEGEVNRLREELQRRETALHRAQATSASQATQLNGALQELAQLRATSNREEGEGEGEGEDDMSESEEEEDTPSLQESSHEVVTVDMLQVSTLQRELEQQKDVARSLESQIALLRDTLTSKDRELEALRLARTHQEQALQQTRAQLRYRGATEGDGKAETGTHQAEMLTCGKEEGLQQLSSSSAHSLLSSTSTMLEESGSRSILRKIADLAPILSQEAHTVNQLSKNNQLPGVSMEQLAAAVNSLSQVVGALSERVGAADSSGGEEELVGVLGAVQRLVQELTVVLSSLDHGNATQLPQQLSAVSDLLSQLISADREALIRDTNALRETIASLQIQLQQQSDGVSVQTQEVFKENEQLRIELRDAEHRLQQQREINTHQRASLEAESSRNAQLEQEKLASVAQLETEVKGLQRLLKSVTSDLDKAQSHLAEYQEAEGSLEHSAHTISSLHQELRASKEKEAELENALQELTQSQSELGLQQSRTHMQHQATLTSLQEALELERTTKDEVTAQLSEVQSQLQQSEKARQTEAVEKRQMKVKLVDCQRELERVMRAEETSGEREAELDRVQALLQSLEADNREQGEHYNQLLENERRMVVSLRSSLQAKERELTEIMDKFLQEKVALAKVQGELVALRARCETDQQHISSLQSKLSSLRAQGESRAGEESVRQLEIEQLRRQLHQLQATSEKQVSEAVREKQQLQASVSRLQSQNISLQQKSSRDTDEVVRLSEALAIKEEEVARLREQLISPDATSSHSTLPVDLLQAKLMRLYAKYREAEVHRKALVFQKNYLKCQVDAFFQTQQAALIMMAEMGAPPANTLKSKSRGLQRMKVVVHVVIAASRFQYVVRRRNQYIQSYSNRVEREKTAALTRGPTTNDLRPPTGVDAILSSYKPPLHQPTTRTTPYFSHSPPTTTAPGQKYSKSTKSAPSSTKRVPRSHTNNQAATPAEQPHPSTLLPSLARLQAKLNGAVH